MATDGSSASAVARSTGLSRRIGFIHAGVRGRFSAASSASTVAVASATGTCVPLDTQQNALESVGGKGRSLSNMARAGFNVPGGFLVTTDGERSARALLFFAVHL